MSEGKRGKVFRLYARPNMVLYDSDLQEVRYDVLDDGWVVYKLGATWSQKLEAYVSKVYYMIEYSEEPFVRYVSKVMCVGDMLFDVREDVKCVGGRIVEKMVLWATDKKFKDLWSLL
jgi:hypothetical protein